MLLGGWRFLVGASALALRARHLARAATKISPELRTISGTVKRLTGNERKSLILRW
jgi:hypothetical protein